MSTRLAGFCWGLASKNIADCDAVRAAIRRIEKQYGKREDGVPVGEDSERNEFYASKGLYGRVSVKGDLDSVNGARLLTLLSSLSAPDAGEGRREGHGVLRRCGGADGFCELLRRYERAGLGPVGGRGETARHGHGQRERHDGSAGAQGFVAVHRGTGFRVDGLGGPDQYRTLRGCWRATAPLPESCWTKMVFHSTAARKREQRRCRRGGRWRFVMAGARSRGAERRRGGAMLTILFTGNDGGPTDLDNLILLCGHHHRTLHHTEWRVEIGPDRKTVF